jgi:arsenate reductase
MNNKPKILFICVHNSARSQMAEAFFNDICGAEFEAQSAGLEPGTLNPLVIEVMREVGFDLSKNKTQAVFDVFKSGQLFAYVITVCSEAEAGGCPIFPGPTQRLHWPFPDPSKVEGTREEKLAKVRQVRNAIQARIEQFCAENCARLSESGRSLRQPQSSVRPR